MYRDHYGEKRPSYAIYLRYPALGGVLNIQAMKNRAMDTIADYLQCQIKYHMSKDTLRTRDNDGVPNYEQG